MIKNGNVVREQSLRKFYKSESCKYKNYEFRSKSGDSHFNNETVFSYLNQKPKYMLVSYDKEAKQYYGFVQFYVGFSQQSLDDFINARDRIIFKLSVNPLKYILDFIHDHRGVNSKYDNYVEIGKLVIPHKVNILKPKKEINIMKDQLIIGKDRKLEALELNLDEVQPVFKKADRKKIRLNYKYDAVKRKYIQI